MSCSNCSNCSQRRHSVRSGTIACKFWDDYKNDDIPNLKPLTGEFQPDLEMYGPEGAQIGWAKMDVLPGAKKGVGTMKQDCVLVPMTGECFFYEDEQIDLFSDSPMKLLAV